MALRAGPNITIGTGRTFGEASRWNVNPFWSLTGLPQLFRALEKFEDRIVRYNDDFIVESGSLLVDTMKETAREMGAVDTGAMVDSIALTQRSGEMTLMGPENIGVAVGPTVEYAAYVEFGTDDTRPKPFMRVAFDRVAAQVGRNAETSYRQNMDVMILEVASQHQPDTVWSE